MAILRVLAVFVCLIRDGFSIYLAELYSQRKTRGKIHIWSRNWVGVARETRTNEKKRQTSMSPELALRG